MQITNPKSFLKLLLIAFALAILPLVTAFISANGKVEYKKRGLYPIFSCARDLAANVFRHGEV